MEDFMGVFLLCLLILSGATRAINSKFFIKISHKKRIFTAITISLISFVIIAISTRASQKWGFYTSLLGAIMCGSM
jgi:hypothetical protein